MNDHLQAGSCFIFRSVLRHFSDSKNQYFVTLTPNTRHPLGSGLQIEILSRSLVLPETFMWDCRQAWPLHAYYWGVAVDLSSKKEGGKVAHVTVHGALSQLKEVRACALLVLLSRKSCLGHLWKTEWKDDGTGEAGDHAMFSSRAFFCQGCHFSMFKLQILPGFLRGECIQPSSTVGGIKKSCMTTSLPHSYLLYHGLQQLHWASTWHTCLVCANISVSPSSPLIYIATFIAALSLCFTCYN